MLLGKRFLLTLFGLLSSGALGCAAAQDDWSEWQDEDGCASCDGEDRSFYRDDNVVAPADAGQKDWTVMVYFATHVGSSAELSKSVRDNLRAMRSVGAGRYANVIIQYHRPETGNVEGAQDVRLELARDGISGPANNAIAGLRVVENLGDMDSGSPATLRDFVAWARERYPAKRYALIMHGHGLAWEGFGLDENHDSHQIKLTELGGALAGGLGGARLDLIMMDACLMGSLEVAAEMQPYAQYLLTSENIEISAGQPYKDVLPYITKHPRMTTDHIVVNLAHAYVAYYSRARGYRGPVPETALTLVGLDLDRVGGLVSATRGVADAIRQGGHSLATDQIETLLASRDMSVVDDGIHSADLYQTFASLETAEFLAPEVHAAAASARDFIGYPNDGYNPAERAVVVRSEQPGLVVFGLNGWTRTDDVTGDPNVRRFEAARFGAPAPRAGLRFAAVPLVADPARPGSYTYTFYPFVPNVLEFNWMILDEEATRAIAPARAVKRARDYYVTQSFAARSPESPLIVEAHTQGYYFKGSHMVHGLGIFFGTSMPRLEDYAQTKFAAQTRWQCIFGPVATCAN